MELAIPRQFPDRGPEIGGQQGSRFQVLQPRKHSTATTRRQATGSGHDALLVMEKDAAAHRGVEE
jgi:hypothetical protein